jgi:hypothetical protein
MLTAADATVERAEALAARKPLPDPARAVCSCHATPLLCARHGLAAADVAWALAA